MELNQAFTTLDRIENSKFPKAFIVSPNAILLPPEEFLPELYRQGFDAHMIDNQIRLDPKELMEKLYMNVSIAFDLFPRSVFLFNTRNHKIDDALWCRFLFTLRDLPKKGDFSIRIGLLHDVGLFSDSIYQKISTENLLIKLTLNRQENIARLVESLRKSISERRKFPRFNCLFNDVKIVAKFKIKRREYEAYIFDLSNGHFSCIFRGSPPLILEYEKIDDLILNVDHHTIHLPSVFYFTRDFLSQKYNRKELLYVFSFSGQIGNDQRTIDRIDDFLFRNFQKYTRSRIEAKQHELADLKLAATLNLERSGPNLPPANKKKYQAKKKRP